MIEWLHVAAPVPGFDGFAVDWMIWEDALRRFIAGTAERSETVRTIAQRYLETFEAFTGRA